jgi:hypothetical protein
MNIRRKWSRQQDNIKIDFKNQAVDWMHLAQDRAEWRDIMNKIINLQFP